jgi:hypothetical protein
MRWRGRAGEIVDDVDVQFAQARGQRMDNIAIDHVETWFALQMPQVLSSAGEETVEAQDPRAIGEKCVAQMRSDKATPAGNEHDPIASMSHGASLSLAIIRLL